MNDFAPPDLDPGSLIYVHKREDEESHYFHAHRGIEILYIYEGIGEIMVENRTYPLRDHTLVWFQPYQLHRVTVPSAPSRSYVRTNLTFDPAFLERYLTAFPSLGLFFRKLWRGSLPQQIIPSLEHPSFADILEEMERTVNGPAANREENMGLLMLRLVQIIQQHTVSAKDGDITEKARTDTHIEKITGWLDDHYKEPFRLEQLADDLHLSPYHISHVFKENTGITLTEYVIRRRVREACVLLANTGQPVQQIAAEVGGLSPSYFSQMFRKSKGMSPEQYRKSIR